MSIRFSIYQPREGKLDARVDESKCHAAVDHVYGSKIPGISLGRFVQCSRKAGEDGLCGIHRNLKARNA